MLMQGMNVVRLNMSHGDHKSHKAVVDLVREYNRLDRGNLAIMLDTKGPEVRSGDIAEPIEMKAGKHLTLHDSGHPHIQAPGQQQASTHQQELLLQDWHYCNITSCTSL